MSISGRLPSSRSSSVPLMIRDLKEKMETSQRPKMHCPASPSKLHPPDKRQCRSELVVLKQGVAGGLKQKNKSVSLPTPSKPSIQKREGTTSRSNMKQKEDDVKSVQLDKKQTTTPKRVQNIPKTPRTPPEVLTRNNQKQNRASQKDLSSLKPRAPCQPDRKATSTNDVKSVQLDKKQISTPKRVQDRSKTPRTPEVLTQNNQKLYRAFQKDCSSLKPLVPCRPDRKATSTNIVKSVQLDKKQSSTPKRVQDISRTPRTPEVLTQNNQKQNYASQKDRSSLKPRVPCQPDRKATSIKGLCREVKTSKKAVENSVIGARKVQSPTYVTGKGFSLTKTKNFSGKKRPTDEDIGFDGTAANNVQKKEKERSVKCNITIDGSSNWESLDRKNGMDVVSFTSTSPIKKSVPESDPSGQSAVKGRGLCLNFEDDQHDTGTSEFPSFRTPVIDSDALSKLKELSSIVETSQCDTVREGPARNSASAVPGFLPCLDAVNSASAKHDKMFHLNMQKDKSMIQHDSDASSVEQMLAKAKLEWQGMEVSECNSNSETEESGISQGYQQHPCTLSSLETDDSCITSNCTTTLTSNGNQQCTSTRSMELLAEEIEFQDSTTSLPNTIFEFTSTERWSSQWEFDYIKELLIHTELVLEDLSLSHTQKVINPHLFDELENQKRNMDPFLKVQRKALFDCVSACLESRRDRASGGSYEEWARWSMIFRRKDLLADEIQKEISGWTNMEDLMVNEVVDKEITQDGKWLDFEAEALEEGVVVENAILTTLIDEMVTDFLSL